MRPLFIHVLIMSSLLAPGQPAGDLQKQLDDLRNRVRLLEKENIELRTASRNADSTAYCSVRLEIFEAFTNMPQLEFDFKSTSEKISVTGLFARLMQANNPASDILGFRFTDLVISAAEKHLARDLRNDNDRKRFSEVISKIIGNPLVSSLASSNPITSVVSTVISCIIGFTTNSVQVSREGGRINDVSVDQVDAFESASIAAFRNDMQIYINFYDELILASQRYLSGLEDLEARYAFLMEAVRDFRAELHGHLNLGEQNELIRLTCLLPEPGNRDADFNQLLQDNGIRQTLGIVRKFPVLQQSVMEFKKEYNMLLFSFLEDYIRILESARKFPDQAIDKSRTDDLIDEIRSFIDSQKKYGNKQPDAFRE